MTADDFDPRVRVLMDLQPSSQPVEEREAGAYAILDRLDAVDPLRPNASPD